MVLFSAVFREESTKQLREIYMSVLGDMPVEDFKGATRRVLRTCKFFPKPAEIIEAAEEYKREIRWTEQKKKLEEERKAKEEEEAKWETYTHWSGGPVRRRRIAS